MREFKADGKLDYIEDTNGNRITADYTGNLLTSLNHTSGQLQISYNAEEHIETINRMTSLIDAKGNETSYGYDAQGNLETITYPDATVESWGYDSAGNTTLWTNRRGNQIGYEYDPQDGQLEAKTYYPQLTPIEYMYDDRGNLNTIIDPCGVTTMIYDPNDRLQKITYPGGRYLEYTYNSSGRRESSIDQLGHLLN